MRKHLKVSPTSTPESSATARYPRGVGCRRQRDASRRRTASVIHISATFGTTALTCHVGEHILLATTSNGSDPALCAEGFPS